MNRYILSFIIIILSGFFLNQVRARESEKELLSLKVHLKNIKSNKGKIYIAVFDSEENFMKKLLEDIAVPVSSTGDMQVELKLPVGEYAISIFHDTNDNGKLNTNFMGIPKEPYGFSNNPNTSFGPPNFKKTSFEISASQTIEIKLK